MSRTVVSGASGRNLSFPSGNWECLILGRVAKLMGTRHYEEMNRKYDDRDDAAAGRPLKPDWFYCDQAHELDGPACREFAEALINVTDEAIATIHPETFTFEGTPEELKAAVIWQGKQYRKLKKGYKCLG